MSLASMVDADLEGYISSNREVESCWFFIHIPKTAGSSFRGELSDLLWPNHNVHVDDDHRAVTHEQKLADATIAFGERLKQAPCRFASGHVPIVTLTRHLDNWRELKLITMLREPVRRVISDYRYQTTPAHPSHREFLERHPTLMSFAETARGRNKMFRYLRPSAKASLEDAKAFVIEHFAFVGIVEMYPLSFHLLTRVIGQERGPSKHLRKTADTEYNQVEITPKLIRQIRDLNNMDVELYDYFRSKLLALRPMVFS